MIKKSILSLCLSKRLIVFVFGLLSFACVHAAYAAGGSDEEYKTLQALKNHDYATALVEARKTIDAGNPTGYYLMGLLFKEGLGVHPDPELSVRYFSKAALQGHMLSMVEMAEAFYRGVGVTQDQHRALEIAHTMAQKIQDPHGKYLVFRFFMGSELSIADDKGKPDTMKHDRLAARPVSERSLDTEAYDLLYQAAAQGEQYANVTLAWFLGTYVGLGNRQKMLNILDKMQSVRDPMLDEYKGAAERMNGLGESYVAPRSFASTDFEAGTLAEIRGGCPSQSSNQQKPELRSIKVSRPLREAVYLPSKIPGYEQTYLISGNWEEEWTYNACGKTVPVPILFVADGLGGIAKLIKGK